MMHPAAETREQREQRVREALAAAVVEQIVRQRLKKTRVARGSGFSSSHLRSIVRAEKSLSLFNFLELSHGLKADPVELLKDVLVRSDVLRNKIAE